MTSRRAGRSNTSRRHSRVVSRSIGNVGCFAAATSRSAERCRCCQSGVRWPGRRRGSSSARADASRNALANSAVPGSARTTSSSISSGSNEQVLERDAIHGLRQAEHDAVVAPQDLRARADAVARGAPRSREPQGACTRWPNGDRMQMRQSPSSSRNRSTTIVRSSGTAPVASRWSSRYLTRFSAASSSSPTSSRRRSASRPGAPVASSRVNAPRARPSSSGRPGLSPFQNGILPGSPGAGATTTRSRVMSSIRQVLAPSTNISPAPALVDHLLVELADTASRRGGTRRRGRGRDRASVGDGETAARPRARARCRRCRSQTRRGRSSANSSDG